MRTLLLIFSCKRPKYVDTIWGGVSKNGKILRTSIMYHCMAPKSSRARGWCVVSLNRKLILVTGRGDLLVILNVMIVC